MAISVGTPVMKCDRNSHKKGGRSGNAKAIIQEAFPDKENGLRYTSDEDYDKSKTKDNLFWEFSSETGHFEQRKVITSNEIVERYYSDAEKFRIKDKNGNEKKLRSDANICVAGIIKPAMDSEEWQAMDNKQKVKFLTSFLSKEARQLKKRGIQLEYATVHMDEMNPHIHWLGRDKNYQMGKAVNLTLFRDLNETIPKQMQQEGYKVSVLAKFDDEAYSEMSKDEKEEYVIKKKQRKEKYNQDSRAYKVIKDAQKKLDEAGIMIDLSKAIQKQNNSQNQLDLQRITEELNEYGKTTKPLPKKVDYSKLSQRGTEFDYISDGEENSFSIDK